MSEAMSSVEIEDVLSSIRRLVSEDLRPAPKLATVTVEPKVEDKLILTPAFRVVTDSPAEVEHAVEVPPPEPVSLAKPLPRLHLGAEPVIEKVVATLERAVGAQDIEFECETGDPAPMVVAVEWGAQGWVTVDPEPAAEDAVAESAWVQPEEADFAVESEMRVEPFAPIAEPDPQWADAAEAEVVAQLSEPAVLTEPVEDHADEDPVDLTAPLEMSFDESVLRDLVRDLIREELQGALGERITRNVRKLVRAEIARALAAQSLE